MSSKLSFLTAVIVLLWDLDPLEDTVLSQTVILKPFSLRTKSEKEEWVGHLGSSPLTSFWKHWVFQIKNPNSYLFSKRRMVPQNKDLPCLFLMGVIFAKCFCVTFKGRLQSKQEQLSYQLGGKNRWGHTTQGVWIITRRILASVTTQMLVEKFGNITYPKNIFLGERKEVTVVPKLGTDRTICKESAHEEKWGT